MPAWSERRRAPRVLLLATVGFGLAAMHTLGHPSHEQDGAGPGATAVAVVDQTAHHTPRLDHPNDTGADTLLRTVGEPADGSSGPHDDLHLVVICLAVLAGAFTIGMLTRVAAGRQRLTLSSPVTAEVRTRPRAPPLTCARRLAQLSVLRI